jgi:hypothetical protein
VSGRVERQLSGPAAAVFAILVMSRKFTWKEIMCPCKQNTWSPSYIYELCLFSSASRETALAKNLSNFKVIFYEVF